MEAHLLWTPRGESILWLPCPQVKACEALEALDEMLETELPIITPHLSEVLTFCLEVSLGWVPPLLLGLLLSFPACF